MRTLLITGFEPFGGENINPSWEAVKSLPNQINGYLLEKKRIPVVFGDAAKAVIAAADALSADVILCIGQAGGRDAITPELVAINLRYASIPDNNGNQPMDEAINPNGEAAYFSTLPVRKMTEAINNSGLQAKVSYSAGSYVCNDVLYTLLDCYKNTNVRVGFIHIPYCTEQNKTPSMDIAAIVNGLTTAIEHIDD